MRYVIAGIACLFSATALAHPPIDSTMAPCPILDENYQPIPEITSKSERLDIAKKKLRESGLGDGEYHWVCDTKLVMSGTGVDPDPVDPPPVDCDVTPRPASCPPIDPPPVDCDAEPRPASCPPIDPPPVDCDADPSHSDCPPTDPNEPVDPPPTGECGRQDDGSWVECPQPTVQYKPAFPTLGDYSVAGVCEPFPQEVEVTLKDREPLDDAYARLKDKAAVAGVQTGAIVVPWDVDTLQCEKFRPAVRDSLHTLTIKGALGPNGEQPRFYCRRADFDGTTPKAGEFIAYRNKRDLKDGVEQHVKLMIENIHIDGYSQWLFVSTASDTRLRNNYMHHSTNDGLTTPGISFHESEKGGINYEVCGNEIAYAGNGNASHCLYMHRSERASFGVNVDVKFVDNVVHSCNYSSGIKSIANNNLIVGNKFYKHLETDPSYSPRGTQMMVDIPSCSNSLEIRDNLFHYNRVDEKWMPGNSMIGIRNRANMFGCDIPQPPYLKGRVTLADGSKHICYRDPTKPECAIPDSQFWDPGYWADKSHEIPIHITGNTFEVPLDAYKGERATAVSSWGSYPYYRKTLGSKSCVLPTPDGWYERTMVYLTGNTYINVNPDQVAIEEPMFTTPGVDSCGFEYEGNSNPEDWKLITKGADEVYQGIDWQ